MTASATERTPWPLPCQTPEQLATKVRWRGFVGADNIEPIVDRVKRIVVPGRTFVITRQDSEASATVEQGSMLFINPEAFREPIEWSSGNHGGGMSVNMSPGIRGFGVDFDSVYDSAGPHPMTSQEVREYAAGKFRPGSRLYWSYIEIDGGLDDARPGLDLITIRKRDDRGYRETIQVIPADIPWQCRHERDAIAADQLADALEGYDGDDAHPAHGVARDTAETAAIALRTVAANLRQWREPLTDHEVFPAYKEMR